jgi:transposase
LISVGTLLLTGSCQFDHDVVAPDAHALAAARSRFRSAAAIGSHEIRRRSTKIMRKHHALARRMIDREPDYLRFTHDPQVPCDNNAASARSA